MTKTDDECPEGGPHEWVLLNFQNLTPGAVECRRCPASEEAREAAWAEYDAGAEWEPRDRFAARDNFAHGFDAGVVEGIRQAREAVETVPVTQSRNAAVAAIDALGGEQ